MTKDKKSIVFLRYKQLPPQKPKDLHSVDEQAYPLSHQGLHQESQQMIFRILTDIYRTSSPLFITDLCAKIRILWHTSKFYINFFILPRVQMVVTHKKEGSFPRIYNRILRKRECLKRQIWPQVAGWDIIALISLFDIEG